MFCFFRTPIDHTDYDLYIADAQNLYVIVRNNLDKIGTQSAFQIIMPFEIKARSWRLYRMWHQKI